MRFSSLYIGILAATTYRSKSSRSYPAFQFPLHRDPRCNAKFKDSRAKRRSSFSSLYIGILAATVKHLGPREKGGKCFSSLYIGILAATYSSPYITIYKRRFQFPLHRDPRCNRPGRHQVQGVWRSFSSLYIGILAATVLIDRYPVNAYVSVPFTSGSSLQPLSNLPSRRSSYCFSSLYIGILAATSFLALRFEDMESFSSLYIGILAATLRTSTGPGLSGMVSVPFTSGSSLQPLLCSLENLAGISFSSLYIGILAATTSNNALSCEFRRFQFPLHRDPRCNFRFHVIGNLGFRVSVPFTSGSSLQPLFFKSASKSFIAFQFPLHRDPRCNCMLQWRLWHFACFSSLYIGILAATAQTKTYTQSWPRVSVPFTSGSSLQLALYMLMADGEGFQFPLHRDPRCNQKGVV